MLSIYFPYGQRWAYQDRLGADSDARKEISNKDRSSQANAAYVAAFPEIKTAVLPAEGGSHMCMPVNNTIENNRYCRCKVYADVTSEQVEAWHSTMRNNTEVTTC